jgi:hypothetical protein
MKVKVIFFPPLKFTYLPCLRYYTAKILLRKVTFYKNNVQRSSLGKRQKFGIYHLEFTIMQCAD